MKKFLSKGTLIRLGLLIIGIVLVFVLRSISPVEERLYRVARVVDGDTVEIKGGEKIRYIGIDAPEISSDACFAKEATEKNKELVEGRLVRLEMDLSETDKYGRLLRYVYVEEIFVNDFLVREGYANVYTIPPDLKYQEEFKDAEKEARENNRGLWTNCPSN